MGEDPSIPPYTRSARQASLIAARRKAGERMHATLRDADRQQTLGERALARGRRGMWLSVTATLVFGALAVQLLAMYWAEPHVTDEGLLRAAWTLTGGTASLGLCYLASGGIQRARRRSDAGRRLLMRAERQRSRAKQDCED